MMLSAGADGLDWRCHSFSNSLDLPPRLWHLLPYADSLPVGRTLHVLRRNMCKSACCSDGKAYHEPSFIAGVLEANQPFRTDRGFPELLLCRPFRGART